MKDTRSAKLKAVGTCMKIVLELRKRSKFEPGEKDNYYFEEEVMEVCESILTDTFLQTLQHCKESFQAILEEKEQQIEQLKKQIRP